MRLPKLKDIEYYVDVNSRKFKISSRGVHFIKTPNNEKKGISGKLILEQVVGERSVPVWKGNWKQPLKFEKEKRDKTKFLYSVEGAPDFEVVNPVKIDYKNFSEFYQNIKHLAMKYDRNFPSKENAELFFKKAFDYYKRISNEYMRPI